MKVSPTDLVILLTLWVFSDAAAVLTMHVLHDRLLADYTNVLAKVTHFSANNLGLPPPPQALTFTAPPFPAPTARVPPDDSFCNQLRQQLAIQQVDHDDDDANATKASMVTEGCQ